MFSSHENGARVNLAFQKLAARYAAATLRPAEAWTDGEEVTRLQEERAEHVESVGLHYA